MNYELAKKLKDAGFKQEIVDGSFYWAGRNLKLYCWGGEGEDKPYGKYIKRPTLEELIEACGEKFALHKNKDHWCAWQINSNPRERDTADFQERAPTPTEAVARLWLALNKHA